MTAINPSHPHLIKVIHSPEPFASGNISLVGLPAGAHFVSIKNAVPAERHYTTVQVSKDTHVALNSDLVYCNHSCAPTLVFDMSKMEVRVVDDRALSVGDPLTFFYPSTEWEMDQPFECHCDAAGAPPCQGTIRGAKYLSEEDIKGYWLNEHIIELRAQQARTAEEEGNRERN